MQRVYRSTEQRMVLMFMGIGSTAAFVTLMTVAPDVSLIVRVLTDSFGLIWGYFLVFRAGRAGVFTSAEGIRVVNPFRTRRFFWEDIAGFDLGRWTLFPRTGYVYLRAGSRLHIFGIEGLDPRARPRNRRAEALIGELTALLGNVQRSRTESSPASQISG